MSSLGIATWFADFCILHWHTVCLPTFVETIPFKHIPCADTVLGSSVTPSHFILITFWPYLSLFFTVWPILNIQSCSTSDFCTGCPSAWNASSPDSSLVCSSSSVLFKFKGHLLLSFTLTIPASEPSLAPDTGKLVYLPVSSFTPP